MQEMRLLIIFIMLIICAVDDHYNKTVNIFVVIVLGLAAFLLKLCSGTAVSALNIITGMMPGMLLYILSKLKLNIGEADGIIFIVLGMNLGTDIIFRMMLVSFFLGSVYSMFLLIKKKKGKTFTFAFVPFILISFCVVLMKNKYKTGSMTIELSLIMPGIMAILILIIFTGYYLHDRCVIKRASYSACLRETDIDNAGYDKNRINETFEQLIEGRLLGAWQLDKDIIIDDEKILMNVSGHMSSPIGLLNNYIQNAVFSINMNAYSYFCRARANKLTRA